MMPRQPASLPRTAFRPAEARVDGVRAHAESSVDAENVDGRLPLARSTAGR